MVLGVPILKDFKYVDNSGTICVACSKCRF